MDISEPRFGRVKNFIGDRIKEGTELHKIKYCNQPNKENFEKMHTMLFDMNGWNIALEEWYELVSIEWEAHESTVFIEPIIITKDTDDKEDVIDGLKLPVSNRSSWQRYKSNLKNVQNYDDETINNIETDSYAVLKQLRINTAESGPVKGLVVGSVQSGKTTNMAALIAQAADNGFNVFIVLSGIIENLRVQTFERLFSELDSTSGEVNWTAINRPRIDGDYNERPESLQLNSNQRYLTVCLKNKKRLTDLLKWLTHDQNKIKNMKILLIDDEADQASVNTVDVECEERKAINSLIVKIVENKLLNGNDSPSKYKAMNYVGYTATPYANVLTNESSDSLYPKSFISVLARSKQYFGPTEIFGLEEVEGEGEAEDGLDIVRIIDSRNHPNDVLLMRNLEKGTTSVLPESLKIALGYYLGAVASLRTQGYVKPLSMLIHTSNKTSHHSYVYDQISMWLKNNQDEVIKYINESWSEEIQRFNVDDFKSQFPSYSGDIDESYKLLSFDQIFKEVKDLLSCIEPAKLDDNGIVKPNLGITLSMDNSKSKSIQDENEYLRLVYTKHNYEKAPVYIVVGGATLSRGLTLEGLITSYFLRSGSQADTLMQMGRWFGYRRNIELYPRIWLSEQTKTQFKYLSALDYELRKEIYDMKVTNQDFSKIGPKIKNSPRALGLKLSSKNRMRQAEATSIDYTGTNIQTYIFDNDVNVLRHNIDALNRLINELGKNELVDNGNQKSIVWRNVSFNKISNFLVNDYKYCSVQRAFSQIELFQDWVVELTNKGKLKSWNVTFVSLGDANDIPTNDSFKVGKYYISKVNRSMKRSSPDGLINLGALSSPGDVYRDIDINEISDDIASLIKKRHSKDYHYVRQSLNMEEIPLLVLYLVNGKTTRNVSSSTRVALNLEEDIFGFNIFIPNGKRNDKYDTYVRVKMPDYGMGKEDIVYNDDVEY